MDTKPMAIATSIMSKPVGGEAFIGRRPHTHTKANQMIKRDLAVHHDPYHFSLLARFSNTTGRSATRYATRSTTRANKCIINLNLIDGTHAVVPVFSRRNGQVSEYCTFRCPLSAKPRRARFQTSARHLSSVLNCNHFVLSRLVHSIVAHGYPLQDRRSVIGGISQFLHRVVQHAAWNMDVDVSITGHMELRLDCDRIAVMAAKFHTGGEDREEAGGDDDRENGRRRSQCPVCFEDVAMTRLQGLRLFCGHEFHLRCILPWLTKKNNTCPTCRREQKLCLFKR